MPSQKKKTTADQRVSPFFGTKKKAEIQDGGSLLLQAPHTPRPVMEAALLLPASKQDFEILLTKISEVQTYLASEIPRSSQSVAAEIQALGGRITALEDRLESVVDYHNSAIALTNMVLDRVDRLEAALEDISNRSRRNNIRLRGLTEEVLQLQLEGIVKGIFTKLVPSIPSEEHQFDRIHRALRSTAARINNDPRDVIVRLHYYKSKEAIMKVHREHQTQYEDKPLQLFQDLAPSLQSSEMLSYTTA